MAVVHWSKQKERGRKSSANDNQGIFHGGQEN
jgi:hypothetical protein